MSNGIRGVASKRHTRLRGCFKSKGEIIIVFELNDKILAKLMSNHIELFEIVFIYSDCMKTIFLGENGIFADERDTFINSDRINSYEKLLLHVKQV